MASPETGENPIISAVVSDIGSDTRLEMAQSHGLQIQFGSLHEQLAFLSQQQSDHEERSPQTFQDIFQSILNSLQDVVWSMSMTTLDYLYISPSIEMLYGRSPEEFAANPNLWLEMVHPDDRLTASQSSSALLQTGSKDLQYRIVRPDGEIHWIRDRAHLVYDDAGSPLRIDGVAVDITESFQIAQALATQSQRERLLAAIAQNIRESLDLNQVLVSTVSEVRHLLQTDRVVLFEFAEDWTGTMAVESVSETKFAILGEKIHDPCFSENYVERYRRGHVSSIEDIRVSHLNQCHVDLLTRYQVRANLVVPILQQDHLWGLLIAHHCTGPRHWQKWELDLLKRLATQVGIGIQQSQLYGQTQEQADREKALGRVVRTLRSSLDFSTIMATAARDICRLFQADHLAILQHRIQENRWTVLVDQQGDEALPSLMGQALAVQNNALMATIQAGEMVQIEDSQSLSNTVNHALAQSISGSWLLIPLMVGETVWGCLALFRTATGVWKQNEMDLAETVADQLAIAIQQSNLYQQVQQLNLTLEQQVEERTAQLQEALNFEALLKRITDKVRDSLDETHILQTVVQELAIALNLESCNTATYDLEAQTATVNYEYARNTTSTLGSVWHWQDFSALYDQLLQRQWVLFCDRHNSLEEWFSILACPMFDDQGMVGDLWLLRPTESVFRDSEVRLVQQVANQCAIAIRQARLYGAAQRQVEELERLNQLKDDFLSTISHELRTPVASIQMASQMLDRIVGQLEAIPAATLHQLEQYVQLLQVECDRELSLVNDLLDLSRLSADTIPLTIAPISLQLWIPHVMESVTFRYGDRQISVDLNIPTDLPDLETDLSLLERILTELLTNAHKYTPIGGHIQVTANHDDTWMHLRVQNSGITIPAEERSRIFDKFYRIPSNDPWQHQGTGLGLALVKKMVEQLQGAIELEESSADTIFRLQLPLVLPRSTEE